MMTMDSFPASHPIAYLAVRDPACRSAITEALYCRGWSVVEHPTGLHLIHAISGVILGDQASLRPGLIVVDAVARGCTGASIARGLRELDLQIPVVLIADPRCPVPATMDAAITIVDSAHAADAVARLLGPLHPALLESPEHQLATMA
jgi:FixJ family two-component response regulator